jgi:hypothetical protein
LTDETSPNPDLVKVEFSGGPHEGESDLYPSIGDGQPPGVIGRTVEATGETAWYRHLGGHSYRDQWTFTFKWDHTDPPVQAPFSVGG